MTASELTQSVVNAVNDVGAFETGGAGKGRRNRNVRFLFPQRWESGTMKRFKQLKNFDKIFKCRSVDLVFFVALGVLGVLERKTSHQSSPLRMTCLLPMVIFPR